MTGLLNPENRRNHVPLVLFQICVFFRYPGPIHGFQSHRVALFSFTLKKKRVMLRQRRVHYFFSEVSPSIWELLKTSSPPPPPLKKK